MKRRSRRSYFKTSAESRRRRPFLIEPLEQRYLLHGVHGPVADPTFLETVDNSRSVFDGASAFSAPDGSVLSGSLFNDINQDGIRQPTEPGLANRTVYLDQNTNGRLDIGEPSVLTDANGGYTFNNVAASSYVVATTAFAGWKLTTPNDFEFASAVNLGAGSGTRLPITPDLNADGVPDLVVSNAFADTISVFLNDGAGGFSAAVNYAVGDLPRGVEAADFDKDGDLDLVATNLTSANVSVLLNNGAGSFSAAVNYLAGGGAWLTRSIDLNNDGKLDVAVMNQNASTVSILRGNGDGTFVSAGTYATGTWPHDIIAFDADGDNDIDLLTANLVGNTLTLLKNSGTGTFTTSTITAANGPLEITRTDVDGDGKPDLAVENLNSNNISIFKANGDGTFQPRVDYAAGLNSHRLQAADLDGDDDVDFAVANYGSDNVSILFNDGLGNLSAPVNYAVGDGPLFVEAHDFDNDGDIDLVASNSEGDSLSMLLNNGDGTFAAAITVATGLEPRFMTVVDFNRDGALDIVTSNFSSGDVSLIRNRTGEHRVSVAAGEVLANLDFGSAKQVALGDQPSSGHSFKIRIDKDAFKTLDFVVGAQTQSRKIKVRRYAGDTASDIRMVYEVVEGNAANWNISLGQSNFLLGKAPVLSTADSDPMGTVLPTHFGDGDIDNDDLARLEANITGPGVKLTGPQIPARLIYDLDGDLDIDNDDRAILLSQFTGPYTDPWNVEFDLNVKAVSTAPIGATARLKITAIDTATGESRSAFAHVKNQPYGPLAAQFFSSQILPESLDQLMYGAVDTFKFNMKNLGADPDVFDVSIDPVAGYTFQIIDAISATPMTTYSMGPGGPDVASFPNSSRPVIVVVTATANAPRGTVQNFTFRVHSTAGNTDSTLGFKITKAGPLWGPDDISLGGGRRHQLMADEVTTFGMTVTNTFAITKTFSLTATPFGGPVNGWSGTLSQSSVTLAPGAQTDVIFTLDPPAAAALGSTSDWTIALRDGTTLLSINRFGGQIDDVRNVLYVALDALAPQYMSLNAAGTAAGSTGDWLMPNLRRLMEISTTYTSATDNLPSYTDPNHTAALSGSAMGMNGVASVIFNYFGRDEDGAGIAKSVGNESLRYGPNGDTLPTIFDVSLAENPSSMTYFATGKGWMSNYFRKPTGGARLFLDAWNRPQYVGPPPQHTIGDPPSDPDAATDPALDPTIANWGTTPGLYPDDRFIAEGTIRAMDYQDPDVMYVLMAGPDDVGHMIGDAWDPADWDTRGTPELWDDIHISNPRGQREDILDEIRETDAAFGEMLDNLIARGKLDKTYIALLADHSMITLNPHQADLGGYLESHGYGYKDDYDAAAGGGVALFFEVAENEKANFENLLENAPPLIAGYAENPWIVISRDDMLTGIDAHTGTVFSRPGELYSQFFIEQETDDNSKPRWVDFLMLFSDGGQALPLHFDSTLGEDQSLGGENFVGGHAGSDTQPIPLIIHGPGLPQNVSHADPVRIDDIAPTFYRALGWNSPDNVQGTVLPYLFNNLPPTADAGGPYAVMEGDGVSLSAAATTDPENDPLTYTWDINRDGVFGDAAGVNPSLTWAQLVALGMGNGPATFWPTVRVSDGNGGSITSFLARLDILASGPTVIGSGTGGVRGELRSFTFSAVNPVAAEQNDPITYCIDWDGNGTVDETIAGTAAGVAVQHSFASAGTTNVKVFAYDNDRVAGPTLTYPVTTDAFQLRPNVGNGSLTDLVYGGTPGLDAVFFFIAAGPPGSVTVFMQFDNTALINTQTVVNGVTGKVIASGYGGGDALVGEFLLSQGVEFYGGDGDDVLVGGFGADLLDGGLGADILLGGTQASDGADTLLGGEGRDLLWGHLGADSLVGDAGDDLLLGNQVTFGPQLPQAVFAIQAEWLSGRTFAERVANISGVGVGPRLNGSFFLQDGVTVLDDAAIDQLTGGADQDWFVPPTSGDSINDPDLGGMALRVAGISSDTESVGGRRTLLESNLLPLIPTDVTQWAHLQAAVLATVTAGVAPMASTEQPMNDVIYGLDNPPPADDLVPNAGIEQNSGEPTSPPCPKCGQNPCGCGTGPSSGCPKCGQSPCGCASACSTCGASACSCSPGDANGDGRISRRDVAALMYAVYQPETYAKLYPGIDRAIAADVNGDMVVDAADIDALVAKFPRPNGETPCPKCGGSPCGCSSSSNSGGGCPGCGTSPCSCAGTKPACPACGGSPCGCSSQSPALSPATVELIPAMSSAEIVAGDSPANNAPLDASADESVARRHSGPLPGFAAVADGRGVSWAFLSADASNAAGDDLLLGNQITIGRRLPQAAFANQSEWLSRRTFAERVAKPSGAGVGPRLNGSFLRQDAVTVLDDAAVDELLGGRDDDWLAPSLDVDLTSDP